MGIKKVYPVWVSLLGPDSGLKTVHCWTLSVSSFSLSNPLCLAALPLSFAPAPSLLYLFFPLCVSLPLSSSLSSRDLVLTNRSCSQSLSGACTTPQTRVETGSSRSQSEAWKNGGRRRGVLGGDAAALFAHICFPAQLPLAAYP